MLTVILGLAGSAYRRTRSPLGYSYSVIPPTEALFWTPGGSVWQTAGSVNARMASSLKRIERYGVCAVSKVTDRYTIRHAEIHASCTRDRRVAGGVAAAGREEKERQREWQLRLLPVIPFLGARLLRHGGFQCQCGGMRRRTEGGVRGPRTLAAR